jgi:Rha family phage regulatory protein
LNLEQKKLTSLEVAEMTGKEHSNLLKDIRRYIDQSAEVKIDLGEFFSESTYPDANLQARPCYLITKKGCEFIGHRLTGSKGTEFTFKYIERFHEMEDIITNNFESLSPELQMFQSIFNAVANQQLKISQVVEQSQKALDTSQAIKDTIVGVYDDWRASIKHRVSVIQKNSNMTYQEIWNLLYGDLEKRGKCDLSIRVRNGRDRLIDSGSPKTKIEAFGRLDVIDADARLKEIFTTIVKEYVIKYVA